MGFLVNGIDNPTSNSIEKKVYFIFVEWYQNCQGFRGSIVNFEDPPTRCSFEVLYSVHGRILHMNTLFLIPFNRYRLRHVPCEIWRWVLYLGFEKLGNLLQKKWSSKPMSSQVCNFKSLQSFKRPLPPNPPLVPLTFKETLCQRRVPIHPQRMPA